MDVLKSKSLFLKSKHPFIQLLILFGCLGVGILVAGGLTFVLLKPLTGIDPLEIQHLKMDSQNEINAWRIMFALNSLGVFFLPAFIFSKVYDKPSFPNIGFRSVALTNLILAAALISFSLPAINALSIWNKAIHFPAALKSLEESFQAMSKDYDKQILKIIDMPNVSVLMLNLVVMAFLPALVEEFFFRGCLQQIFQQWFKNFFVAALVTAIIFSAFHFDFYGFLPRVALGLILGWLFAKTGSLWPGIFAHFFNNAMAVVFTYVGQHSTIKKNYATEDLNIPMWTGLISLVIVIYLVSKLKRDHGFDYLNKGNDLIENNQ